MGLCLLVDVGEAQPSNHSSHHPFCLWTCFKTRKASMAPTLSDLGSDSLGREHNSHFTDRCWVTGLPGALLTTTQLCSIFAPSISHRGFLVEFLLIHFPERFMVIKTEPLTPQSSRPNLLSSPQLHSPETKQR